VAAAHRTAEGELICDPRVITDRWLDDRGQIVYGERKTGDAGAEGKRLAKACTIDLGPLDDAVERLVNKLLYTFPDCSRKTLESQRKKKLEHWYKNSETNRSWLSLNMATEAMAGFPAFQFGGRGEREIDFVALRRKLAEGRRFDRDLVEEVLPESARERFASDHRRSQEPVS